MKKILSKYAELGKRISKGLKVRRGDDFYCYPDDNQIFIPMIWNEKDVNHFMENIKTRYNSEWVDKIDNYIWCFLHELGHIKTDANSIIDTLCRPILTTLANLSILPKVMQSLYYKLPKEYNATEWAINYVNEHFNELLKFQKDLRKVYIRYYKSTGVKMA